MNAIQYFDWGGNNVKEIPFCQVRVKDYFTTRQGKNIERYMPIQRNPYSVITVNLINPDEIIPIKIYTKNFEVVREGNDFVCKAYIRSNFRTTRVLKSIGFNIRFNNRPFASYLGFGNLYINGRKIKGDGRTGDVDISSEYVAFDAIKGTFEEYMNYEDNGEAVTFQSLFGKDLVIVLN